MKQTTEQEKGAKGDGQQTHSRASTHVLDRTVSRVFLGRGKLALLLNQLADCPAMGWARAPSHHCQVWLRTTASLSTTAVYLDFGCSPRYLNQVVGLID